jgi:hypothetical protein
MPVTLSTAAVVGRTGSAGEGARSLFVTRAVKARQL